MGSGVDVAEGEAGERNLSESRESKRITLGDLELGNLKAHDVAFDDCRDRRQAIDGRVEAAAGLHIEFPAVARTFENRIVERAFGERPEGVRTFVEVGEDFAGGTDDNEIRDIMFDAGERLLRQISQRQLDDLRTNCGVFQGRVHKGNGRAVH